MDLRGAGRTFHYTGSISLSRRISVKGSGYRAVLYSPVSVERDKNLSKLGGTAEIYLPSLYRDGRFFILYRR